MLGTLAAVAAAAAVAAGPAAAERTSLTVVELFTSQGCSSCPPADALLTELSKRDDILALSVHVDYWDYIGWKDPFASPENTKRQREYARLFGLPFVYTPQMVVQGMAEASGARPNDVLHKIDLLRTAKRLPVAVRRAAPDELVIEIAKADQEESANVWLVTFDREHVTAIKRGENGGRTLRYSNVVREMRKLASWRGEALELRAPVPGALQADGGLAVLVQSTKDGRILGAGRLQGAGAM
jgi:hypothetical protein